MSAETIKTNKEHMEALAEHMESLDKDSENYDRAVQNYAVLSNSLAQAEKVENERRQKDAERVQAIKQWEREQQHREAELEENHTQFMVKTIVDAVIKTVQSAIFVDLHDRELLFEKDDSRSFKFGGGLMSRFPFMK